MAVKTGANSPDLFPGHKAGPAQLEELLRIWRQVDDDCRRQLLSFARQLARGEGLVADETPLMISGCVF